jgi:hypothetical protein
MVSKAQKIEKDRLDDVEFKKSNGTNADEVDDIDGLNAKNSGPYTCSGRAKFNQEGLIRQAVINVEYELKVVIISVLPSEYRDRFAGAFGDLNDSKISAEPLGNFIKYLKKERKTFKEFVQAYRDHEGGKHVFNIDTIASLEKAANAFSRAKYVFLPDAHPITSMDGRTINADFCIQLVNASKLPAGDKKVITSALTGLQNIRTQNAQDRYLYR